MKRGIKIGDYVLAELLSTGGMGQVWLARREFEGGATSSVAIKFPHAAGVLDIRIREALSEEARLQMLFQHSNIPRAIDMGVHEGLPYFVMDYIAGRSLAELLARMRELGFPLRIELVAHVAREIAYALRYAHGFKKEGVRQEVIHRDVAPKNVLLSGQGGVYVIDFGVSEALGVRSSRNHIKGTLLYMAPEHALGFPTPKSDAWGLGAILWEMLEGRQFRGEIDPNAMRRAANEGRHAPLTRADIPDALRFVTEGLLRVDERERLTLDEVIAPLEEKDFPPQRSALKDLMARRFGQSVARSGHTLHDFQMPEQLDRAIAAARMVKNAGLTIESPEWSTEAFVVAGAPPVVATQGTRPVPRAAALDDDGDDSKPRTQAVYQGESEVDVNDEPPGSGKGDPSKGPRIPTVRTSSGPDGWTPEHSPSATDVLPPVQQSARSAAAQEPIRTERLPAEPVPTEQIPTERFRRPTSTNVSETPEREPDAPVMFRRRRSPQKAASAEDPGTPKSKRASDDTAEVRDDSDRRDDDASQARGGVPSDARVGAPTRSDTSSAPCVVGVTSDMAPRGRHRARPPGPRLFLALLGGGLIGICGIWIARAGAPAPRENGTRIAERSASAPASSREYSDATGSRYPFDPLPVGEPEPGIAMDDAGFETATADLGEPLMVAEPEPLIFEPKPEFDAGRVPVEPNAPGTDVGQPGASTLPESSEAMPVTDGENSPQPESMPRPARARVSLELGRAEAMEIEIGGKRRTLTKDDTRANLRIPAGTLRVRWRQPEASWSSREIVLEPRRDYVVHVHPWGPLVVAR